MIQDLTQSGMLDAARVDAGSKRIMPRLLRTSEAARYLGMGSKAIRQMILSGELAYVQRKPGNSPFLLDRRDLDRWLEAHKISARNI